MTPPSAPDAATDRQTVGDILLARGYISEEQLEQAIASQQRSGKPLGQVLVEAGAITRLELASALAEQWSDTASWLGPPEGTKGRGKRGRQHLEDVFTEGRHSGFAEQLQQAVVELARRVASFEPTLTDLKLRVESAEESGPEGMLDRIEVVQDGVTALARRLDELTEGVERAFTSVERSSGELAQEIDALASRVELAAERSALDDIRAAVDAFTARPSGDPILAAQVETLGERVEELRSDTASHADAATLEAIRSMVEALGAQVAASADTGALEELHRRVEELASRQVVDAELTARVDELAAQLAANGHADAIEALRSHVDELIARPQADPALAEQLDELTTRIEALAGTDALDAVRVAVEEIAGRPTGDPELTARIEELGAQVAELASRPQADPGLAAQLEELTGRIEALAGTDALEAVKAAVEEMAGRPAADPALTGRLDELSARLEEVAETVGTRADLADIVQLRETLDALRVAVEDVDTPGPTHHPELEHRIDNVVGRLDALHARVEEVAERSEDQAAPDLAESLRADLESRIASLASRTEGLAQETAGAVGAWVSERAGLEARLDALAAEMAEARFQATATIPAAEPAPAKRGRAKTERADTGEPVGVESELERLRMAVERINMHLGERERAIAELMRSRSSEIKLDELAARLAELEQGGGAVTKVAKGEVPHADADLHTELRELAQRLEEAEKSAKGDRDKVLTQLERMASSIDWRFRRLESGEDAAA